MYLSRVPLPADSPVLEHPLSLRTVLEPGLGVAGLVLVVVQPIRATSLLHLLGLYQ